MKHKADKQHSTHVTRLYLLLLSVHTVYKAVDVNNYAWNFVHKLQELHAFGMPIIIDPNWGVWSLRFN